jgi:hypothetical protein
MDSTRGAVQSRAMSGFDGVLDAIASPTVSVLGKFIGCMLKSQLSIILQMVFPIGRQCDRAPSTDVGLEVPRYECPRQSKPQ